MWSVGLCTSKHSESNVERKRLTRERGGERERQTERDRERDNERERQRQ